MNRISINYSISRTVALDEGRSEFGNATYTPSDTELQFLCKADRAYLDRHERETFNLPTSVPPIWPTLADMIREARIIEEAHAAKKAMEQEANIVAALAKPDDDWLACNYQFSTYTAVIPCFGSVLNAPGQVREDPRVAARLEALKPEIERRTAEKQAEREAEKVQQAAAQAEKVAAKASILESITTWALASEDAALARAASDSYEIVNAVLKRVAEQLQASVGGEISTEGTSHWRRWDFEERAAPSAKAFEVYDATKSAIVELDKPSGVLVDLKRIARIKLDPVDDCDGEVEFYTAIVAMIELAGSLPCKTRALIIRVEE